MSKFIRSGFQRFQLCRIQFEQHNGQVLDAALHGNFLCHQSHISDLLVPEIDIEPHNVVRPYRFLFFSELIRFHMSIARHILENALCLSEKRIDVFYAARESRPDMSALLRKRFCLVVYRCIIFIEEHLSFLKNREVIEITLIFYNRFAQVRKQGRTDISQIRCRRSGKSQDTVRVLKDRIYKHIVHPRIRVHFLHAAADRQILLDTSDKVLIFLVDRTGKGSRERCGVEVVIPVHSGNFLHHVILDGDIACRTPCRRSHMHVVAVDLHLESEFFKLAPDFIVCQMFSKSLLKPCKAHIDLRSLQLLHIVVAESCHLQFRIKFFEIVHGKGKRLITSLRIDRFLISGRRLCTCIIAQRRTPDPGSLKVCHL